MNSSGHIPGAEGDSSFLGWFLESERGLDGYAKAAASALTDISRRFPEPLYSLERLKDRYLSLSAGASVPSERYSALIRSAVELTSMDAPKWEYIAARLELESFYAGVRKTRGEQDFSADGDARSKAGAAFRRLIEKLTEDGLYGSYVLESWSREEIEELGARIDPSRDSLFTWSSLDLLVRRYVVRSREGIPLETPQEMFMGIAMHLAMKEGADRTEAAFRFYNELSSLRLTLATPTLSNARKPFHQLSSCFIDTVPDSLEGIYRSLDSFAQVSKFGGGMGMYFGKVRAVGGPIRGFKGAAGGVLRWVKLANDTAVAVDQLGMRQGSVAVWLDAWHKDLPEFLQMKTNNGDDRMKAHDVFPGVCYPDLFWRLARDSIDSLWHLMCPHEILTAKGWALEDFWGEEWEKRYFECVQDDRISKRSLPVKEIVRLVLRSAVETGTPFVFNRDLVNRMNPNSHKGIIYCSNLCTEIAQNMSAMETVSSETLQEGGSVQVVETTRAGDFVVCNLASLSLGNIDIDEPVQLERTVAAAVRMLDNVIDLTMYPLPYAQITNSAWRAIGLGTSGYHHLLAKRGIPWESEAHLEFADALFERINRAAVRASAELAAERGSYSHFAGSDWATGEYFRKRGYAGPRWDEVRSLVREKGLRNGWIMAVAPTSSTSIIAGTTAGVDPVMKKFFLEEKKGRTVPRAAPELSLSTMWFYKNAHQIDQSWSLRAAGKRQRHIDQSQSVNLYVTTDKSFRDLLALYIQAWEEGVKTLYYVRSQSLEVEECESCSS